MFRDSIFPILLQSLKQCGTYDVPVSAIIEINGALYKSFNNSVYEGRNHLNHAEILAINHALKELDVYDFKNHNATLYSSLEPCCMCLAFASLVRIKRIVYYLEDTKYGGISRIYTLNSAFTKPEILYIEKSEVKDFMYNFFKDKR